MGFDLESSIGKLCKYFTSRKEIAFCYLFGSSAKGTETIESDLDIAIYFRPANGLDFENAAAYPQESEIWTDIERITEKETDLIVLNRAPATISAAIFYEGIPISIQDRDLYWRFFLTATAVAEEYHSFAADFRKIKSRSRSLTPVDRDRLIRILDFLDSELTDAHMFSNLSSRAYFTDTAVRRNVERWVENLVNASIDTAKIVLASQGQRIPQTYRETLLRLSILPGFDIHAVEKMAEYTSLRNLLAHEYLDITYPRIKAFSEEAPQAYRCLAEAVQRYIV